MYPTKTFIYEMDLGWGKTSEGMFGTRSPTLMQVQLPVIDNKICKEKYKLIGEYKGESQFGNSVLCAGFAAGGKDSCHGDSGGPLMLPIHVDGRFPYFQIGGNQISIRINVQNLLLNIFAQLFQSFRMELDADEKILQAFMQMFHTT